MCWALVVCTLKMSSSVLELAQDALALPVVPRQQTDSVHAGSHSSACF